jgi:hypothetical protein
LKINPWGERWGVHPVQRKTFLDVELEARVGVENDFRQQPINGHHCHLSADLEAIVAEANFFARLDLARFVRKPSVMVETLLRVGEVILKNTLDVIRGRRAEFVAVGFTDVLQVIPVCQGILRDGEERVSRPMRLAQRGDESAPRIGAAEVNTAARNGIDDTSAEGHGIFRIALRKRLHGQYDFDHGLKDRRGNGRIILRTFILAGVSLQSLEDIRDRRSGSGLRRAEESPDVGGNFQIQLLCQRTRMGFLVLDEAQNLGRQAGLGFRGGAAREFQHGQKESNDDC